MTDNSYLRIASAIDARLTEWLQPEELDAEDVQHAIRFLALTVADKIASKEVR